MFQCKNLSISVGDVSIIHNLSLSLMPGTIHALMGPNGSGKSTLAHTIAGNPMYTITNGSLFWCNTNLADLSPDKRARLGLFLSFQQPPAIPGLTVLSLLKESYRAVMGDVDTDQFHNMIEGYLNVLNMDRSFLYRSCNDGFSGGERKRLELLQLLVLCPKFVILDEIDSGLDIDAFGLVVLVINLMRKENPSIIILLITHYTKMFEYITPDYVHVLSDGRLVKTGDCSLVTVLAHKGYDAYKQNRP